jgi:hypothetical protein
MKVWPVFICSVVLCVQVRGLAASVDDPLSVWQQRNSGVTSSLNAAAFGAGRWVAVGNDGVLLYSTDGQGWDRATIPTAKDLYSIVYAQDLFVVGGSERTILTSTNGIDWTSHPGAGASPNFAAAYGNGQFLLAGGSRTYTSEEGEIWLPHVKNFDDSISGLTFGSAFVGVGYDDDNFGSIYTSTDGVLWAPQNPGTEDGLLGAGYGGGNYVAVGDFGVITVSTNGEKWSVRTSGTENSLWDVEYGHGFFVTVGWGGDILTSSDANLWVPRTSGTTNALYGVNYGNRQFIAVGRNGTILFSDAFPADTITLSAPAKAGNDFTFQLSGTVGQRYNLELTSDLKSWSIITNVLCNEAQITCVVPAIAGSGVYRASAVEE